MTAGKVDLWVSSVCCQTKLSQARKKNRSFPYMIPWERYLLWLMSVMALFFMSLQFSFSFFLGRFSDWGNKCFAAQTKKQQTLNHCRAKHLAYLVQLLNSHLEYQCYDNEIRPYMLIIAFGTHHTHQEAPLSPVWVLFLSEAQILF